MEMSQINVFAEGVNMEKREIKLTAKAMENKIERLQHERKIAVNKIKGLIPQIKAHMKSKENATEISSHLNNLNALCKNAIDLHNELQPLLPEDEVKKQNDWFSSIMDYSDAFKEQVEKWILEQQHEDSNELPSQMNISEKQAIKIHDVEHALLEKSEDIPVEDPSVHVSTVQDLQDELQPCDSISNASKRSRSSARSKAERNLAILAIKQKALKEKYALDEEELKLRRKREQLLLENEIAEEMAKLSVMKSQSSVGSKFRGSKVSDGMNSYFERTYSKQQLNINAAEFVPSLPVEEKPKAAETTQSVVKPKVTHLPDIKQPPTPSYMLQRYLMAPENPVTLPNDVSQNHSMMDIMRKQNEITTLLMQQQSFSALPKREIPVFDGNPLRYHSFIKAFENGVEKNTNNNCDRLYFLEQYTKGHAKELVRSCQHIESDRGYLKAKALLREHYGNEQKVASAYMERALSWSIIKTEDVKALQEYSLFLQGCCNAMEDVQYLNDLDTPTNMLEIIKKLPYKLRDRWRCHACDLQEKYNRRARFMDIASFVEKQVKILTDPVFGNIQDTAISTKQMKYKTHPRSSTRGTSFATTVNTVERTAQPVNKAKEIRLPAKKICPCCSGGHTLDVCAQLEKMEHKEKIDFLKENGACFRCLCIGHIGKNCQRKIYCSKCGQKHPTVLHKDGVAVAEPAEKSVQATVHGTLVSSGLTGAGEMECKLPIVPVPVKAKKGNKIILTYAFLDQGSTAVFCTENLKQNLNLTGKRASILLRTMGQEKVVNSYIVPELEVAALEDDIFIELPKAYTQLSMPVHKANIPTNKDLSRWPYLKHLNLPQINAGIELLIGTNVPRAMEPHEVIRSEENGP